MSTCGAVFEDGSMNTGPLGQTTTRGNDQPLGPMTTLRPRPTCPPPTHPKSDKDDEHAPRNSTSKMFRGHAMHRTSAVKSAVGQSPCAAKRCEPTALSVRISAQRAARNGWMRRGGPQDIRVSRRTVSMHRLGFQAMRMPHPHSEFKLKEQPWGQYTYERMQVASKHPAICASPHGCSLARTRTAAWV